MSSKRKIVVALIVAVVAALAGCGKAHSTGHIKKVEASQSALAHSKQVQKAEAKWRPVVDGCATQQHHWLTHPVQNLEATFACSTASLTPAQKKSAETCAESSFIHNGLSHVLQKDEIALVDCLVKVAPSGAGK